MMSGFAVPTGLAGLLADYRVKAKSRETSCSIKALLSRLTQLNSLQADERVDTTGLIAKYQQYLGNSSEDEFTNVAQVVRDLELLALSYVDRLRLEQLAAACQDWDKAFIEELSYKRA